MKRNLGVVLVSLALLAVGCSRVGSRTDAQVASDVQNKINGDSNVPGQTTQHQCQCRNGNPYRHAWPVTQRATRPPMTRRRWKA